MQTAPGKLTIGTATIGDSHPHGLLTVSQIIEKSSNVGTAKMALQMQPQEMWEMFTTVGFGQQPKFGFPGAVAGRVRPYKSWRPIEQATMSYGHGISVSLMQLAHSYMIFARDGDLIPPLLPESCPRCRPAQHVIIEKDRARDARDAGNGDRPGRHRAARRRCRATASPARPAPRTRSCAASMSANMWHPSSASRRYPTRASSSR